MILFLTPDDIKLIHHVIEEQFPSVTNGIKDPGIIESIAERPEQRLFGTDEIFPDIFSKAACLMEAITRLHPFIDGNKRTGLLTAFSFLYKNGYYLTIPLSSVKFTVKVADTREQDQETILKLIKEISKWLKKYSTSDADNFSLKVIVYFVLPVVGLLILDKIGFKKYVTNKLIDWFSIKNHPEYEKEVGDVSRFLGGVMHDAMNDLKTKRELKKKKK